MRKDSTKVKIMCLLHNNEFVKRSALISMFPNLSRTTVNKAVRDLLPKKNEDKHEEAYIMESRKYLDGKNSVRVLSLTEKGERYLKEYLEKEEIEEVHTTLDYIRSKKRKNDILNIYACLRNFEVLMEDDKDGMRPRIELLSDPRAIVTEEDREKLLKMDESGAFYSIREIRKKCVETLGDGPLNQTRCLGAIVRKNIVFLVYNMGNKMIRFDRNTEQRTRDIISRLFYQNEKVTCILFGTSNNSAIKLIYDNPKGLHPALLDDDGRKPVYCYPLISLEKLSELFPEVFFVISRKNASHEGLMNCLRPDKTKENLVRKNILNRRPGTRAEIRSNMIAGVETETGRDIFFSLDGDLLALRWLFMVTSERTAEDSIIMIVSTNVLADLCSRILGPKLHSVETMRGEPIPVERYNNFSEKITEKDKEQAPAPAAETAPASP